MQLLTVELIDPVLYGRLTDLVGVPRHFHECVVAEAHRALTENGAADLVSVEIGDDVHLCLGAQLPAVPEHTRDLPWPRRHLDGGGAGGGYLVGELTSDAKPDLLS
jgi:hypothetical protein